MCLGEVLPYSGVGLSWGGNTFIVCFVSSCSVPVQVSARGKISLLLLLVACLCSSGVVIFSC